MLTGHAMASEKRQFPFSPNHHQKVVNKSEYVNINLLSEICRSSLWIFEHKNVTIA
jgi:hypothetical protein